MFFHEYRARPENRPNAQSFVNSFLLFMKTREEMMFSKTV